MSRRRTIRCCVISTIGRKATHAGAIRTSAIGNRCRWDRFPIRSEEHTSELQSLMRISYAVFCLKKKTKLKKTNKITQTHQKTIHLTLYDQTTHSSHPTYTGV